MHRSGPNGPQPTRPGEPDIPEERNPRGHDSQPDPSPIAPPEPSGHAAAVGRTEPQQQRQPAPTDEAKFIADEFDIPARRVARAVAGDAASDERVSDLAADVHRARAEEASVASVPTPESDDQEHTADSDETALKPVLDRNNQRLGAG